MAPVKRTAQNVTTKKLVQKKGRKARKAVPQPKLTQRTAEEVVVDNVQSFELVRCVIIAAISSVAWVRDLFHEDCFEPRMYDYNNPDPSYEAFKSGQHGFVAAKAQTDRLFHWKILVPSVDKGVDKLLYWLENGVAEALRLKYLSEIQLRIYDGSVTPEALVEAYVIEITYEECVASLQVNLQSRGSNKNSGQKTTMLADAKRNISKLVNNVIVQAQILTDHVLELPASGILDMNLGYNETCPPGWIAPGFKRCTHQNLILNSKSRVESADTGYHHIQISLFNKYPTSIQEIMPADSEKICTSRHPTQPSYSSAMTSIETQESGLNALRNIGTARTLHGETQDTQQLDEARASLDTECRIYTQAVVDQIIEAQTRHQEAQCHNLHNTPLNLDVVQCECEAPDLSHTPMLKCDICSNFKHFECYGYLESRRPRMQFVCYTCLRSFDKDIVVKMQGICVKRRILYYLREGGNVTELGQILNKDELSVLQILAELSKEGHIILNKGKLKGKGKIGEEPAVRFIGIGEYFQPYKNIQHLFTISEFPQESAQIPMEKDATVILDHNCVLDQQLACATMRNSPEQKAQAALQEVSPEHSADTDARTTKRVKTNGGYHSANSPWVYRRT